MPTNELLQARLAAGAIEVSPSALRTALYHIRHEKEAALDNQDFEDAATWRDNEKNVLAALGSLGLARPENI